MMIFTFENNGRRIFYTVHEGGLLTVSQHAYSGREISSALTVKDIPGLVANGTFIPFNNKAAIYAKEIATKSRNRHLVLFIGCVALAVGSILLGVWS